MFLYFQNKIINFLLGLIQARKHITKKPAQSIFFNKKSKSVTPRPTAKTIPLKPTSMTPNHVNLAHPEKIIQKLKFEQPFHPQTIHPNIALFFENIATINLAQKMTYLEKLHQEDGQNAILLTQEQLEVFFDFILKNREIIHQDLIKLAPGRFYRVARKNHLRSPQYQDKGDIPFTLEFQKNTDNSISVYFLPKSKLANYLKDQTRKYKGASRTVSKRILLNPRSSQTKIIEASKKNYELITAERETKILQDLGINNQFGTIYTDSQKQQAINASEAHAFADLTDLINPKTQDDLLAQDITYDAANKENSTQKIFLRLMQDIVLSMQHIHHIGIIHNDIKPPNILLFLDKDGLLRARITDFDLAVYQQKQLSKEIFEAKVEELNAQLNSETITQHAYECLFSNLEKDFHNSQPVATGEFASPQVAGFVLQHAQNNSNDLHFPSLIYAFKFHYNYGPQVFASQILESKQIQNVNFNTLTSSQKDDMFSLGISLYMLITGHYPCISSTMNKRYAFSIEKARQNIHFKYLDLDSALTQYPLLKAIEPLIRGLLADERELRLNATQSLSLLEKLNNPPPKIKL